MDEVLVTMKHVRKAKMCSKGARSFFRKHDLNWSRFLRQGLPASEIEATGDKMALDVVKVAKDGV